MTPREAFLTVHAGIPRQGPGTPEDVLWALERLGISGEVSVCDAGCGPGADCLTLATALPEARIEGVEALPHLAEEARARLSHLPHVRIRQKDMEALSGPYDLIWCAGALYFLGVTEGLRRWCDALAPGGAVAFSEPVLLPGEVPQIVRDFWAEYPAITDLDGIVARIEAAGYAVVDHRLIVGAGWEAYYTPMKAHIAALRAQDPGPDLIAALDAAAHEIAQWEAAPDHIAYALMLVRPA
ncbi:class I SAM-dependent methyltransferase [Thalassococcus sp. CAU 1522]|uniref:Class I SAM-dependent methyltransferase n=1 Tax=Thalassococcus arenae TaxID=2851652 RepID=A0ABS6NB33_9RHOB|nr:class I SAM-dependent methyltransferase [Thalassococcus arenae]MBV2361231.1 class I SAM-dependent methyltransferase [Thalassococcus arenae]